MSIAVGPAPSRLTQFTQELEQTFRTHLSEELWDAPYQAHWHSEMQHLGLRLMEERNRSQAGWSPEPVENLRDLFLDRFRQALAVLRGEAYARPLRQPQMLRHPRQLRRS